MTVEASKKIRALLAAAGYGKADVSVYNKSYSMGSTVYVTIKRAEVPLAKVEAIAAAGESIHRDESGEILGGGNTFVDTRYAHEVLDDYAAQINAQIDAGRWRFGIFSITNDDRFTLSAWRDAGDGSGRHVLKMDRASPGDGLARLLAHEGMLAVISETEAEPPLTRDEQDTLERAAAEEALRERAAEAAASLAEPIERVYSLDNGAEGERLAARVIRAAERWQAAFPCPAADEPRLRALWLAVERLIAHDDAEP